MDQRPNIRAKVIKLFEENIAVNLHNFGLGRFFLTITPKTQSTKEKKKDKLNFIKIFLKLYFSKVIIKMTKRQPKEREKIFANQISDKGFIPQINKELLQFINEKKKNLIQAWTNDLNRDASEKLNK